MEIVDTSKMLESQCEFCGLKFWINEKDFSVLHAEPMCIKFAELDILDFLKENRLIKTARKNLQFRRYHKHKVRI